MPISDWRVACFRRAFLRHAPESFAVMLAPAEAQRLGQKYIGRRGAITDAMIVHHLHGAIALAAPAAVDGRAHLLPLDIDAGGIDAIQALLPRRHSGSCGPSGSIAGDRAWPRLTSAGTCGCLSIR
jgi:hypothetical protein